MAPGHKKSGFTYIIEHEIHNLKQNSVQKHQPYTSRTLDATVAHCRLEYDSVSA